MDVKGTPQGKRVLVIGNGTNGGTRREVIAQAMAQGTAKPSLLERLAQKVEPKAEEKPEGKSQARLIKQFRHISQADSIRENRDPSKAPRPTQGLIASLDQRDVYRFYEDGSLRNVNRRLTREERNAKKKARKLELQRRSK